MEIILSNHCKSLTGILGSGFGYHIQRRKNGFFAKRNSKGIIPPDGHWRFITTCAELAQNGLHIADIRVSLFELGSALKEARIGYVCLFRISLKDVYDAADVLILKERIGL